MLAPNKTKPAETKEAAVPTASYTSHPAENYRVGPYRFTKGLLVLTGEEEIERFDALLQSLPPADKRRVRKLDVAAAEEFVRKRLENATPAATQAFDSSIGERAVPQFGTGKLEDSNAAADTDSSDA